MGLGCVVCQRPVHQLRKQIMDTEDGVSQEIIDGAKALFFACDKGHQGELDAEGLRDALVFLLSESNFDEL